MKIQELRDSIEGYREYIKKCGVTDTIHNYIRYMELKQAGKVK